MKPVGIGVIGCGNISDIYLNNLSQFDATRVVGCTDIDTSRAREKAESHGLRCFDSAEALVSDPGIELVVNLTIPSAHARVAMQVLEAGKHVYNEKPLAVSLEDAGQLISFAEARGLRLGCAPDTPLGAGHQACRRVIDDGLLGACVAGSISMQCRGHECWHPDPAFYYEDGGGPLFDMGPYYLTLLVHLLGPVRRVAGMSKITFPQRIIESEPKRGERIDVEVPTHIAATLEFAGGAIISAVFSFDVWPLPGPWVELSFENGMLRTPDPNEFGGEGTLFRAPGMALEEVPSVQGRRDNARGMGVADMAVALREGRPHRASGTVAYHVLEIMHGILQSSSKGRHVEMKSTCDRPVAIRAADLDAWIA